MSITSRKVTFVRKFIKKNSNNILIQYRTG